MNRIVSLLVTFLVVSVLFAPSVLGAETRTVEGFLRLDSDSELDSNYTFNLSAENGTEHLNWNQTVQGFQNESGIDGAFTGPFMPPLEVRGAYNLNNVETFTFCGKVRFKTEWIMSGSSESWWRVPERGPYYGDNVNLTIWRVGSPDLLNFTDALVPNTASHPVTIFNYSYDLDNDELNQTFRWYNTTAWNHTFNSTWLRVSAPIHGDDFYAVRWQVTNSSTYAEHWVRFSQNDIGDDRDFSTWFFYPNGSRIFIEADIDFSVIHVSGHGYAMWGEEYEVIDNIIFNETFNGVDGTALDTYNPDWIVSTSGSSSAEIDTSEYVNGGSSVLFYRDGTNDVSAQVDTDNCGGFCTFSVYFMADETNDRWKVLWADEGNVRCYIWFYSDGNMRVYYGNGVGGYNVVTESYSTDTWQFLQIDVNLDNDKYRVWLDGGLIPGPNADGQGFDNFFVDGTSTYLNRIYLAATNAGTGYFWFDEIYINTSSIPDIEFYTEISESIENGDYLTVMVPFFETVDNSTNVYIGFGTQNDSWATGFWVAEHGPTDFGLKSVLWDVAWPATEMKIHITIYNTTRRLWIMDRNTLNDPDITFAYNRHVVENHDWAPDDYYFGGVPYHSLQVTNGSWENAEPPPAFYLGGRELRAEDIIPRSEHSDDWYIELWLTGYEGVGRVTAAMSFAITGQWDKASDALNPEVPFPTDAPWFFGKYIYPTIYGIRDFLNEAVDEIWMVACWIYEGVQWIVKNAPWIIAGTLMVITFFIIIPLWARFYRVLQGLIKFGWTMADKGLVEAAEFADQFWTRYISTSYIGKLVGRGN